MALRRVGLDPFPPKLALGILKTVDPLFILMDTKHFKLDFSIIFFYTTFTQLISTTSKLYYTYNILRLLMIVCIILIFVFFFQCLYRQGSPGEVLYGGGGVRGQDSILFLLTFFQESDNLDAIFKVKRKINKIHMFVLVLHPPPFLVKSKKKKHFPLEGLPILIC